MPRRAELEKHLAKITQVAKDLRKTKKLVAGDKVLTVRIDAELTVISVMAIELKAALDAFVKTEVASRSPSGSHRCRDEPNSSTNWRLRSESRTDNARS